MSGFSSEDMTQKFNPVAPIDFLQKPFTPETLLLKVRSVLDKAPSRN
jgi:hypothetical protein